MSTHSHDHKKLLAALQFAAERHRFQHRKGAEQTPYINHPIAVAHELAKHGDEDTDLLCAALLHDVIEDTTRNEQEIEKLSAIILADFGENVLLPVMEVSDNKNLPIDERKELQVKMIANACNRARKIRIADKICNVRDLWEYPPKGWGIDRKIAYIKWSQRVVEQAQGVNASLEEAFVDVAEKVFNHLTS